MVKGLLIISLISFICLSACSRAEPEVLDIVIPAPAETPMQQPEEIEDDSSQDTDDGLPPDAGKVGLAYADPQLELFLYINNAEWDYYKDRSSGQVYFFNIENENSNNSISISSYELKGDAEKHMKQSWEEMERNFRSLGAEDIVVGSIEVGGSYTGDLYLYELKIDGLVLVCSCVIWCTENRMYICTTSAESGEQNVDEVVAVFSGIMDTFSPMGVPRT